MSVPDISFNDCRFPKGYTLEVYEAANGDIEFHLDTLGTQTFVVIADHQARDLLVFLEERLR